MLEDIRKRIAQRLINRSLINCSRWSQHKIWMPKPHDGPLRFDKFPWQKDILDCEEDMVTVQKAAQMGFSVAGIIKTLFKVDQQKVDVLYVLPTAKLAGKFAKARLDAIVALSPELRDMFIGTNNVGLKTTNDHAHIYIEGSISESGLVSSPVGTVVVDEFDRCNTDTMALVLERMAAHDDKHFFGLSTPTLPDFGINKQYILGTQEKYVFPCPSCSKRIELLWPESIEICGESATDPDCHKSYLKCPECGSELPHEEKMEWLSKALWVPTAQAHGHRSFHINQMYGSEMKPGELVIAYFKGEADDAAAVQFKNQKLGEPHLLEGARLTDAIIDECLGNYRTDGPRPQDSSRMITMGVDIGTYLDVVISEFIYTADPGYEPHLNSHCKVLFAARFAGNDFSVLDQLMAEWQVHYACLDFQPETISAKAFCRRFHKFASVVQYRRGTAGKEIKEELDDDRVSILTVNRTDFMDMSLGRLHKGRTTLPRNLPPVMREHLKAPARTYELDEFGKPKAVYVALAADHLAQALTYSEIAHMMGYSKKSGKPLKPGESIRNM